MKNIINHGSALEFYDQWDAPTAIISDGAYGIKGFPGDPAKPSELPDWYEPHIAAWTEAATPSTSLWFWNTEVGWASVHPVLERYGWQYVQLVTWDKGIAHIAGNVNSNTIRRFPVVTEVAGLYVRPAVVVENGDELSIQDWLRAEWKRAGFAASLANEVCGVKNAASRKWLTADHLWYMPPFEMFEKLRKYANAHGDPEGAPYFQMDNQEEWEDSRWSKMRSVWNHTHGLTNVWQIPALRSSERVRCSDGTFLHTNQKPQELMERQIIAVTNPGDAVWEPFGGLASASVAAKKLGRSSFAAEPLEDFWRHASERLDDVESWDFT